MFSMSPITSLNDGSSTSRAAKEENAVAELNVMLLQERTKYSNSFDYLALSKTADASTPTNERVSEGWRRKICEWSYEVVDHFGFDREVVSVALDYLDRVVALSTQTTGEPMHRREFQLIAVTSLYLAIKLHGETDSFDGPRRKLKIQAFVELSRNLFTVETLEAKEKEVLQLLNWQVNPPTTVRIVATLLHLLPEWSVYEDVPVHATTATTIYEMARYLTELAVCVSSFSFNFSSSQVAYASILCAMEALQNKVHIPYEVRVTFMNKVTAATQLTPQAVQPVRNMLKDLCPAMFTCNESTTTLTGNTRHLTETSIDTSGELTNDGKVSPVCVVTQCRDEPSPRKRGRN